MVHVSDIAPALVQEEGLGNIRSAAHPTLPLRIFNYTEKCVYERHWNETTMTCRGLVVDHTGEVVARPFRKFFNVGEPDAPELDPDQMVWVTNKHDGSLGIAFWYEGQWHMASRGSFTSEQAVRGHKLLRMGGWGDNFVQHHDDLNRGMTYLFEIIYPENRIVLDYGATEELRLLAGVGLENGWIFPHYPDLMTAREALALPDRTNAEGYVLLGTVQDGHQHMWKVKQADYLARHKIIFGLNERVVWEWMMDPDPTVRHRRIVELPDELQVWAEGVVEDLDNWASKWVSHAMNSYKMFYHPDRKTFAMAVEEDPRRHLLFKLYDGASLSDIYMQALKDLKPRGDAKPKWGEA